MVVGKGRDLFDSLTLGDFKLVGSRQKMHSKRHSTSLLQDCSTVNFDVLKTYAQVLYHYTHLLR